MTEKFEVLLFSKEVQPIMNTTNGHNPILVDAINAMYNTYGNKYNEDLYRIVFSLAQRDRLEVEDKIMGEFEFMSDFDNVENAPEVFFERYGYDFLIQICDDADLDTILSYCRFEYNEEGKYYKEYEVEVYFREFSPIHQNTWLLRSKNSQECLETIKQAFSNPTLNAIKSVHIVEKG